MLFLTNCKKDESIKIDINSYPTVLYNETFEEDFDYIEYTDDYNGTYKEYAIQFNANTLHSLNYKWRFSTFNESYTTDFPSTKYYFYYPHEFSLSLEAAGQKITKNFRIKMSTDYFDQKKYIQFYCPRVLDDYYDEYDYVYVTIDGIEKRILQKEQFNKETIKYAGRKGELFGFLGSGIKTYTYYYSVYDFVSQNYILHSGNGTVDLSNLSNGLNQIELQ